MKYASNKCDEYLPPNPSYYIVHMHTRSAGIKCIKGIKALVEFGFWQYALRSTCLSMLCTTNEDKWQKLPIRKGKINYKQV